MIGTGKEMEMGMGMGMKHGKCEWGSGSIFHFLVLFLKLCCSFSFRRKVEGRVSER